MYSPDHARMPGTTLPTLHDVGDATSTDAVLFAGGRVEATAHTPDSASRPPSLTVAAFPGDRLRIRTRAEAAPADPTVTAQGGDTTGGGAGWCHIEFDAI